MALRRGELRPRNMTILAGWLFADLLLGLMVIFLVSAPGAIPKVLLCLLTPTSSPAALQSQAVSLPVQARLHSAQQAPRMDAERSAATSDPTAPGAGTPTPAPCPTHTPTPTPTPAICGLDLKNRLDETITVQNPDDLRNQNSAAEQTFANNARTTTFAPYANRAAGYVEIFGGSLNHSDDGSGENMSRGIIGALKLLENQHFVFDSQKTFFQDPEYLGKLNSNQAHLFILFYQLSNGLSTCA